VVSLPYYSHWDELKIINLILKWTSLFFGNQKKGLEGLLEANIKVSPIEVKVLGYALDVNHIFMRGCHSIFRISVEGCGLAVVCGGVVSLDIRHETE